MGRPPRRSGHLAGTFAPPKIVPSQGNGQRRLPSAQPLHSQPPQPQVSSSVLQQNWQSGSSQYSPFFTAESFTPSTIDAVSPVSSRAALSPGITPASNGYTAALAQVRQLSPDAATPDTPTNGSKYQDLYFPDLASQQPVLSAAHTSGYVLTHGHAIEDVMGIGNRAPSQETPQYLLHSPRFISATIPSPTSHQRYPGTTGPWSGYPLRQEDPYGGLDTSPSDMMDFVMDNVQIQSPPGKGGGRTGPLSQEQRQHASEVRRHGACLRCSIMREKCDLQSPCTTCSSKDRRKAPKKCIPKQFDTEDCRRSIFPRELTERLRASNLVRSLSNASFILSPRPPFLVPLEMHVQGVELHVKVKEFDPLHSAPDIRHAYRAVEDASGQSSLEQQPSWSPPIIMYMERNDVEAHVKMVQKKIYGVFGKVLNDPDAWNSWTWMYFQEREEDFQAEILQMIGAYYRKHLDEHAILKESMSLLWFEYLLMVSFTIPRKALPRLEANLDASKPREDFEFVIPETINRFLKAIILPMAEKAAKKLTEHLHDLLFKLAVAPKSSTTGQTDIALCMLLILNIFIGRTQATLVLLANSPREEDDLEYNLMIAKKTIQKMESVSNNFDSLQKYTLSRKSCKSPTVSVGIGSPFEAHARECDLERRLLRKAKEYADQKPGSFRVGKLCDTFRYTNVRRHCWRVLTNLADQSR